MDGKQKTHDYYDEIIKKAAVKIENNLTETDGEKNNVINMYLHEKLKRIESNDSNVEFCSDPQFRHFIADLNGAAFDTSFTTLRWIFLFIALNKDVQAKIHQEMINLKKPPALINYEELIYLRATIAETQRIRSIVPLGIPHGTLLTTTLNGYVIPKGSMIIPLQWAIHMNESNWTKPDMFNPNRFIDENGMFFTPSNFMPFQVGECLIFSFKFLNNFL